MNEPLSKKELNALMNIAFKSKPGDKMLSPEESDALSEIVSIAVNSAATALSVLVDGNAAAENINVAYISSASLSKRYHKTLFVSEISFIKGLE
ncbi:MAG TPA: hypothetical protein PLZ84_06160, partial [Clostridia bacterium]|nr:hypothetical protein [Clostridia bacterium]